MRYFLVFCFCQILLFGGVFDSGKVVKVIDGDTIVILSDTTKQLSKIRLFGINAPELKALGGLESKKYLSKLIYWKKVKFETFGFDKYKRQLAIIYHRKKDINAKMVKDGFAKPFLKYSKKYKDLSK